MELPPPAGTLRVQLLAQRQQIRAAYGLLDSTSAYIPPVTPREWCDCVFWRGM